MTMLEVVAFYLFGSIIETLIGNVLFVELLRRINFFKERTILLVIISSILFALGHYYDGFAYVIVTFFIGIVLNAYYLKILKKEGIVRATVYAAVLHFAINYCPSYY